MRLKTHSVLVLIVSVLILCGCSAGGTSGRILTQNSFSSKYSDSAGFMEVKEDVIELYNMVETAYGKSDKKMFTSFRMDFDKFEMLYNGIKGVTDRYSVEDEDKTIMVETALNAALLSKQIAGLNLLMTAGGKESPEWFEETNQVLQRVYDSFTGESAASDAGSMNKQTFFDERPGIETPDSYNSAITLHSKDGNTYLYSLGDDKDTAAELTVSYLGYLESEGYTSENITDKVNNEGVIVFSLEDNGKTDGLLVYSHIQGEGYAMGISWK